MLLALSPFAVAIVTQGVKWFINKATNLSWNPILYKTTLRFIVVLLSFGVAIGNAILSGDGPDASSIQTFVEALLVFLSTTGTFFFFKQKTN